jgi:fatty acid desaturase
MNNMEYNDIYPDPQENVVTVKDWLLVMLLMSIPFVNLIMPFVWAFGGGDIPESKKNWAKAMLLWALIIIGLYIVLLVVFGFSIMSLADSY